jgi:hypothetical protein
MHSPRSPVHITVSKTSCQTGRSSRTRSQRGHPAPAPVRVQYPQGFCSSRVRYISPEFIPQTSGRRSMSRGPRLPQQQAQRNQSKRGSGIHAHRRTQQSSFTREYPDFIFQEEERRQYRSAPQYSTFPEPEHVRPSRTTRSSRGPRPGGYPSWYSSPLAGHSPLAYYVLPIVVPVPLHLPSAFPAAPRFAFNRGHFAPRPHYAWRPHRGYRYF